MASPLTILVEGLVPRARNCMLFNLFQFEKFVKFVKFAVTNHDRPTLTPYLTTFTLLCYITPMTSDTESRLYRSALLLGIFTVLYNLVEGIVSIYFGVQDETLSLWQNRQSPQLNC